MIRTIDGTDYIAKSEVFRIIDEKIAAYRDKSISSGTGSMNEFIWGHKILALLSVRDSIDSLEEQ